MAQQDWTAWWAENWMWWIPILAGALAPIIGATVTITYDYSKTKGLI